MGNQAIANPALYTGYFDDTITTTTPIVPYSEAKPVNYFYLDGVGFRDDDNEYKEVLNADLILEELEMIYNRKLKERKDKDYPEIGKLPGTNFYHIGIGILTNQGNWKLYEMMVRKQCHEFAEG